MTSCHSVITKIALVAIALFLVAMVVMELAMVVVMAVAMVVMAVAMVVVMELAMVAMVLAMACDNKTATLTTSKKAQTSMAMNNRAGEGVATSRTKATIA